MINGGIHKMAATFQKLPFTRVATSNIVQAKRAPQMEIENWKLKIESLEGGVR